VTGFDAEGNPAVVVEGQPPVVIHAGRYTTTELWVSRRGPLVPVASDNSTGEWALEPPPGGSCFRIVEIAPADPSSPASGDEVTDAAHSEFQGAHATATLDYVTILQGEVTLVVAGREIVLRAGDSVVQQPGVPHDWLNRSDGKAVMVGVLLSAG
jgi:quercetin dioxygenase-like cupin family protein